MPSWHIPHASKQPMLLDFRSLDLKEIEADLCIVGAGAAGITLAREMSGAGMRVCVLESGGLDYEPDIQALYQGTDSGFQESSGVGESRLRYLGGSTNHWVGHCAPYTETDFSRRPWIPYSGWPIRRQDLDRYYRTAQELFEIGPYSYDLADIPRPQKTAFPLDPETVVARVWQMSPPTRFGTKYRLDLERARNVIVYLHANVTELETAENASRVEAARIRTLDGKTGIVRARYFVLACGGIENARILLLSDRNAAGGLGNQNDLVGRFYMDHLRIVGAAVAFVRDDHMFDGLINDFSIDGVRYEPMLCPTAAIQQRDETLNWCIQISKHQPKTGEWLDAARDIRDALREGRWPDDFAGKAWTVISDLDSVARDTYHRFRPKPLMILCRCECAPYPGSRITLDAERDPLGQNRVRRKWVVTDREKSTVRKAMQFLGGELGRLGLGRVRLPDWLTQDNDEWPRLWGSGNHQLGTTRMAADPKQGVVNADCRVHSVENLYIAGSSVFPTGGYTHPTLTVGAMALRLADHLKSLMQSWHNIRIDAR